MKKLHRFHVLILALVLCGVASPAEAFRLEARGMCWVPAFTATLRADKGIVQGTELDVKNDLGVGDASFPQGEAYAHAGRHRLRLRYTPVEYTGGRTLAKTVFFNGMPYLANTPVASSLRFSMLDAEYRYDVIDARNILAGFSIGVLAHVKYIDGEARLGSPLVTQQASFKVPFPMLGAGMNVGILANILEIGATVAGMAYGGNSLYEAVGEVSFTPLPFVGVHGGYRVMHLDISEQGVLLKSDLTGPFVAVSVGF